MKKKLLAIVLLGLPVVTLIGMNMAGNTSQQFAAMLLAYWLIGIAGLAITILVLWLLLHKP